MSSGSVQLYDGLGATYSATRRTEPRIAAQVWARIEPLLGQAARSAS